MNLIINGVSQGAINGDVNITFDTAQPAPTPAPQPIPVPVPTINALDSSPLVNTLSDIKLDETGLNVRLVNNRGESKSFRFTTGEAGHTGRFQFDRDPIGDNVELFLCISRSEDDFDYSKVSSGMAGSSTSATLRFIVEYADSGSGMASLLPNTTYYLNVRNESTYNPGYDTCAVGERCGFVMQVH